MDDYIKCVRLIANSEDYIKVLSFLFKHKGEDESIDKWLEQKVSPFIMDEIEIRPANEEEKEIGIDWIKKA